MKKNDVRFLVDYLSFSVTRLDFLNLDSDPQYICERIQAKFFLRGLQYTERHSFYGYLSTYNAQGITICFGGREDIYIQLSGTGCRAFESLNKGLTWEKYISYLFMTYPTMHISRLDVACDTFDLLQIEKIQRYTMAEKFVSKWRTYLVQVGNKENSVIWGSPKSDFRCRIYDKTDERKQKGIAEVPENWVRCEFQLRNEAAQSFYNSWVKLGDLSSVFLSILRNQLIYYSSYDGVHTDRMVIVGWWKQLLGNAGRCKMAYQGGMEYNLDNLRDYVVKQAGSSVRAYIEAVGPEKLLADVSVRPLNDRQRALLDGVRHDIISKTGKGGNGGFFPEM